MNTLIVDIDNNHLCDFRMPFDYMLISIKHIQNIRGRGGQMTPCPLRSQVCATYARFGRNLPCYFSVTLR